MKQGICVCAASPVTVFFVFLPCCLFFLLACAFLHSEEVAKKNIALHWFEGTPASASIDDQMLTGIITTDLENRFYECIHPDTLESEIKESDKKTKDGTVLNDAQLVELVRDKHPTCVLLVRSTVRNAVFEKYAAEDDDPLIPLVHFRFRANYVTRIIEIATAKVVEEMAGECSSVGYISEANNNEIYRDALKTCLQSNSYHEASTRITRTIASIFDNKTLLIVEQVQDSDILAHLQRGNLPKSGESFMIYEIRVQTFEDGQVTETRTRTGKALVYRIENSKVFLKLLEGTAQTGYVLMHEDD